MGVWRQAAVAVVLLSLFVFVVVPTQTYLGSPDLFDYSYPQLLGAGLVGAVAMAAAILAVLSVTNTLSHAPVLGLALLACLYLETGLLSTGLPALNGLSSFCNRIRGGFDALAWLAVFALFIFFRAFVRRHFTWFAASLALLLVASVFDSGVGPRDDMRAPLADGFHPCSDILRNIQFSRNRNVMVYILDMTPASIMADVVACNPELKEKFPGFTAYRRNLGMHEDTAHGLPALMTGRYFGPEDACEAFGMKIYGTESFLYPYAAASNDVYYSCALHSHGYTNRLKRHFPAPVPASASGSACVLCRPSISLPNFRMCDAMAIRLSPYLLKGFFFGRAARAAGVFGPTSPYCLAETVAYPILAASEPTDSPLVLSVVQTDSLHWPIRIDRAGRPLAEPLTLPDIRISGSALEPYRAAMREVGYHVLTQLGVLFDSLRAKGVYDNSTIIIAADHGCIAMREGANHGSESAILWIKPESSRDAFRTSDAPTTNAKIHDLLCRLRTAPLTASAIESQLTAPARIFRADYRGVTFHALGGKLRYTDWVYDTDTKLMTRGLR